MKLILALLIIFMTSLSVATTNITLKTPRGSEVTVVLHLPQGGERLPAIVVAPGRSCNSKGPIFETLGQMGSVQGYAVFRFEWGYCGTSNSNPSDDLKTEIEDFQTVLKFAQSHASVDKSKITIAGKSLGSVVAYSVFANESSASDLVLLTPICSYTTDENGNPLPQPKIVCEENYPRIKDDKRPILMTMGNADDLCILPILYDFLKDSSGNISTFVAGGNHGLVITDSSGNVDKLRTEKNINTVIGAILNWANLNQ